MSDRDLRIKGTLKRMGVRAEGRMTDDDKLGLMVIVWTALIVALTYYLGYGETAAVNAPGMGP